MLNLIKLSMIEAETQVPTNGGEDDAAGFTTQVRSGTVYVNASTVRSLHARIDAEQGERKPGTRIAFVNGSNISVTEEPAVVAELFAGVDPENQA